MLRPGIRAALTALVFAVLATASSCGDDDGGTIDASIDAAAPDVGAPPPTAPSNLTAEPLGGGAHLTWTDKSDNETGFKLKRKEIGSAADFAVIASPTFDATQYHDAPLTSGTTYLYIVTAVNDSGESAPSNEATVAIP